MAYERVLKPEEAEMAAPKALPIIKPIDHTIRDAAQVSKIALSTIGAKLDAKDPVRLALKDATDPKNIEKVHVMKGTGPEKVYSVEITLNSRPAILTIGIGDRAMVVSLTDRQGNPMEDVRQEGSRITVNKHPTMAGYA